MSQCVESAGTLGVSEFIMMRGQRKDVTVVGSTVCSEAGPGCDALPMCRSDVVMHVTGWLPGMPLPSGSA